VGSTYQILLETLTPLIKRLKPETIVLHDAWDGIPVNHHASKKAVEQAMKAESGELDIVKGLSEMANYINALLDIDPSIEIVIDRSNHPDWLAKWVDNTDNSLTTPYNDKVKTELKMAMLRGEDPFIYALKNGVNGSVPVNPNKFKRVIFPQNSFKVGPDHRQVELAEHGDKGANGAKASIQAFARGTDRAIYGHTHKNERKNGIVNIGTFTPMLMSYNKGGFSNWSNSLAVVDEHGGIQVLTFNNGEWHTDYKYKPRADFYFPGYPAVKPSFHAPNTDAGQIDQYSR
jgi:predicted phosphodiesterase